MAASQADKQRERAMYPGRARSPAGWLSARRCGWPPSLPLGGRAERRGCIAAVCPTFSLLSLCLHLCSCGYTHRHLLCSRTLTYLHSAVQYVYSIWLYNVHTNLSGHSSILSPSFDYIPAYSVHWWDHTPHINTLDFDRHHYIASKQRPIMSSLC